MNFRTPVVLLTLISPLLVEAQYFDKSIEAVRTENPPEIDGVLDDPAWKDAPLITDFHQVQPNEYGEPTEPTEARVLYDSEYLYISARLHYSDMSRLTANVMTPQQSTLR